MRLASRSHTVSRARSSGRSGSILSRWVGGWDGNTLLRTRSEYFRYTPSDYPSEHEWEGRSTIEQSRAIKCPSIAYHLVGTKKVQQQLAREGELEKFLSSAEECALLRESFAGLYGLEKNRKSTDE